MMVGMLVLKTSHAMMLFSIDDWSPQFSGFFWVSILTLPSESEIAQACTSQCLVFICVMQSIPTLFLRHVFVGGVVIARSFRVW